MAAKTKQLAHLFDATQCISCGACILACSQPNFPEMMNRSIPGRNLPASNIKVYRSEENRPVNILVQCQQCENAPCVKTCPFGANYYDENGLVRNDPSKCVGCNYCIASCPYDARWSHPDSGLPVKCISEGCLKLKTVSSRLACKLVRPRPDCLEIRLIQIVKFLKRLLQAVQKCLCLTKVQSLTFT